MLIKYKLLANALIIILSMLFMFILLSYASNSFQNDIKIAKNIGNIQSSVLELRRDEKDFLARKNLKYQAQFDKKEKNLKVK